MENLADAGVPIDLSEALVTSAPDAQAGSGGPLDITWAAEILKGTLSSVPAAEILGQQLIDDLVVAIDELQESSSTSTSGGGGHLASLANPPRNGGDGGGTQVQKSFDQDGFSGEMSVGITIEEKGDRVETNARASVQIRGTTPDKLGQTLEVSVTIRGDQDACPTAEGESKGTFSGSSNVSISGANASFGRAVAGEYDMAAYNSDDGNLDHADLGFEGSVNYVITGRSWGSSFTSQAEGVNPKDDSSILPQLVENLSGDLGPPPGDLKIQTDNYEGAVASAIQSPLAALIRGTEFAERLWLTENRCIEMTITPEELSWAAGESTTVEAEIVLKADGGSAAADITAETTGRGDQISPKKANSSPGAPASFTYTATEDRPGGGFLLRAASKAGKALKGVGVDLPRIEWSGTFTMAGSSNIKDVGSSQGTTTFAIRFQADLGGERSEPGARDLVPFELESDSSMSWSGTAAALGIRLPFGGSTSTIITPNYSNPEWPRALPGGDYLAGEGYVDLSEWKLYLFLLGMGDETGYGTFNLSPNTTCDFYHDQATNRVYLIYQLDDEYKIADGSCWDKVSADTGGEGGMTVQSIRSWHFETAYITETQGGP